MADPRPPQLKASATIDIERYKHGSDDFDEWVAMFESAITLATNATGDDHSRLCKSWLPLKLDSASRAIYKQANTEAAWDDLKDELSKLLVDPQEAYRWQAKRSTLKWDGKESFHTLASRIITAVAKFDGNLPEEFKQKEYFFRFREALGEEYQNAIDMACGPNDRNLAFVKDIAQRTRTMLENKAKNGEAKSVTFAGASLDENRTAGLELALAKIDSKLDSVCSGLESKFKAQDEKYARRFDGMEKRFDNMEAYVFGNSSQYRSLRPESGQQSPRSFQRQNYNPNYSPSRGQYQSQNYPGSQNQGQSYGQGWQTQRNFRPLTTGNTPPHGQSFSRSQSPRGYQDKSFDPRGSRPNGRPDSRQRSSRNRSGQRDFNVLKTDDEESEGDEAYEPEESSGGYSALLEKMDWMMNEMKLSKQNKGN